MQRPTLFLLQQTRSSLLIGAARRYATRRPEKPPARFPDPLLSASASTTGSAAVVEKLPDGVTFFRRPPPSAPSPLSTTISPSSPLLRPPSKSSSSSSSSKAAEALSSSPSSYLYTPLATSPDSLPTLDGSGVAIPARMRPNPRTFPTNRTLSSSDFAQMRALRAQDPQKYTRGVLAKMFNCPPFLVGQQVPLSASASRAALETRDKLHEENRNTWGQRKKLIMAVRKKRREFW